jgi:hypothetical protein
MIVLPLVVVTRHALVFPCRVVYEPCARAIWLLVRTLWFDPPMQRIFTIYGTPIMLKTMPSDPRRDAVLAFCPDLLQKVEFSVSSRIGNSADQFDREMRSILLLEYF